MKYYEVEFCISSAGEALQDARDLLAAMTGDCGFEVFEDTADGTKGYVQTSLFDKESIDNIINDFPIPSLNITYSIHEAEYKDWNEQWEQNGFEPIVIDGRCCIHDGQHLSEQHFDISIEIRAKLAFGTGSHETTRMMVASILETDTAGKTVLDCGCGTGILSITALKAGASRSVGYDIDEWSVDNSVYNAQTNRVGNRFCALQGDASVIASLDSKFDIVTANINRNILLADMPVFCSVMNDGAYMILSGFYVDDSNAIIQRAAELGLDHISSKEENGWACLKFLKRTPADRA